MLISMPVISDNASELSHFSAAHSMIAGSSSFITDALGDATQHMEYLPASTSSAHRFGEPFIEQRTSWYYTPYRFTGKELDRESGLTSGHGIMIRLFQSGYPLTH